jgi:predicted transposase YbfD/YdcC
MTHSPSSTISQHFATLTDPRIDHTKRHHFLDLSTIALCTIICGADEWVAMEEFGNAKRVARHLPCLPNASPSHDTFGRVFAALDPNQFERCFLTWVQSTVALTDGAVVAVDEKTARRFHDRGAGKAAIHMVSAWASAAHLVLGEVATAEKSNEVTAIPALLDLLLKRYIVTIDAMGCQTGIAAQIVDRRAEYVLALKWTHGTSCREVAHLFADAQATEFTEFADLTSAAAETLDSGHGRVEIRRYWTISDAAAWRISILTGDGRACGRLAWRTRSDGRRSRVGSGRSRRGTT